MTAPDLPQFIPTQVCGAVGLDPVTHPVDACMDRVVADVRESGVSAPSTDAKALTQVVAAARAQGIDLKVVALTENPVIDTPLRDVATEVGHAYPGSTVLVVSPSFAGTFSASYDRVTLEAGQDVAKTAGNPVRATQNFVDELTTPHFPWTPFTVALVLAVALAAAATRALQVRAKRGPATESLATPQN